MNLYYASAYADNLNDIYNKIHNPLYIAHPEGLA